MSDGAIRTYNVELRGTGLLRDGEHTVTLTARIPATGYVSAAINLMQLLAQTGSFVVTDEATGQEVIVDFDELELEVDR
jgi:hypothetical protein